MILDFVKNKEYYRHPFLQDLLRCCFCLWFLYKMAVCSTQFFPGDTSSPTHANSCRTLSVGCGTGSQYKERRVALRFCLLKVPRFGGKGPFGSFSMWLTTKPWDRFSQEGPRLGPKEAPQITLLHRCSALLLAQPSHAPQKELLTIVLNPPVLPF